jgi:glucose/arabinose dehydrogenase
MTTIRKLATAGIAVATAFALTAPAANASKGAPPPPPTSTNGNKVELVATGLKTPTSFAWGVGHMFVGDGGSEASGPPNGGVFVIKHGVARRIPSPLRFVAGVIWHSHRLWVSGAALTSKGASWRLVSWGGWDGNTFTKRRTIYTAPKGFQGFNGIDFGANGRLYVGVDVGLLNGNDHGPRSTSPFLYEILTFRPSGKDMRIFARGIRQPWQMTFRHGSNSPYVTDLGQDSGAKNPPDFILNARAGQDYGFPKCNWTKPAACAGFAKPFRKFAPHADLMGISVLGRQLYLSSFLGRGAKGPGGEVFSLGINAGVLRPLITGFVAPTVALRVHNGNVFVGELTGRVYRLKI